MFKTFFFLATFFFASLKKVVVIKGIFSLLWHSSKKVFYPEEVSPGRLKIQLLMKNLTANVLLMRLGDSSSQKVICKGNISKKNFAYEPSCPSNRSLSRFVQHISTPGWDASPSQGYRKLKIAGTHLYTFLRTNAMSPAKA